TGRIPVAALSARRQFQFPRSRLSGLLKLKRSTVTLRDAGDISNWRGRHIAGMIPRAPFPIYVRAAKTRSEHNRTSRLMNRADRSKNSTNAPSDGQWAIDKPIKSTLVGNGGW